MCECVTALGGGGEIRLGTLLSVEQLWCAWESLLHSLPWLL